MENSISPEERALITGNLGELDPTAVPALVSMLDSPESRIASDAASALGRIGDPRAIPYLTYYAALNDELSPIRTAARRAITRLTGRTFEQQPKSAVRVLTDEAGSSSGACRAIPQATSTAVSTTMQISSV